MDGNVHASIIHWEGGAKGVVAPVSHSLSLSVFCSMRAVAHNGRRVFGVIRFCVRAGAPLPPIACGIVCICACAR